MRSLRGLTIFLALVIGGGFLHAQPADEPAEGDDAPEVSVPMEKQAQLSPKEMTEKSSELIADMNVMLKRVLQLKQTARKSKDIIKLNCVNEKLLELKQLLNIADTASTDLTEAITVQDEQGRYHQFTQIIISHEKAGSVRDEAEACVGEELIFVGPTEVDVTGPNIPDDPTADDPFDFDPGDLEPPGYASPFY
jgi:hypothetical protein